MLYRVVDSEPQVFTKPHLKSLGSSSTPSINRYQSKKDHESENGHSTCEALMVVALLIATVSYNAMLNPPSGGVQVDNGPKNTTQIYRMPCPGRSAMSSENRGLYIAFTACNTIGFLASIVLILVLVSKSKLDKNAFWLKCHGNHMDCCASHDFYLWLDSSFHTCILAIFVSGCNCPVRFGCVRDHTHSGSFCVFQSQPGQMLHHKIELRWIVGSLTSCLVANCCLVCNSNTPIARMENILKQMYDYLNIEIDPC